MCCVRMLLFCFPVTFLLCTLLLLVAMLFVCICAMSLFLYPVFPVSHGCHARDYEFMPLFHFQRHACVYHYLHHFDVPSCFVCIHSRGGIPLACRRRYVWVLGFQIDKIVEYLWRVKSRSKLSAKYQQPTAKFC